MQQLIGNLGIKRTVAQNSHATVLLMPSQAFINARSRHIHKLQTTSLFAKFKVPYRILHLTPDGQEWSLEAALGCFESFYVLEALHQRWSPCGPCHLFKCNCPECFKMASSVHCILARMVCNPAIRVPATCLGATIQGLCRRGRPCARGYP